MIEEDIFHQALARSRPEDRAAYLEQACAGNLALRASVEALLRANSGASGFMDGPAAALLATADEPIRERPGTVIGPYKLLEQIGEGGFGVVFLAEQTQPVRRKVALKVLKPGMDTCQVVARFEAERQALALMDHPNIARVLDGGQTSSGRPYFVMDLVKGLPITDYCDQAQLTPRERLELFVRLCQAVQHAHQKAIIHRDLKPANVLVTLHDGTPVVKVIDFGIAKALGQELTEKTLFTGFAQMIGTPLYMSPEQAGQSGLDVDTRSDIYSLGVLLYELLTGTTPFDKDRLKDVGYDELRRIIREEEPPRPSMRISTLGKAARTVSTQRKSDPKRLSQFIRGELDWIVMKALEKDRNRRYESANAFAQDIQRYLADEPVQACPPSARYRLWKFLRKYRTGVLMVTVLLGLLLTGVAVSTWQAVRATQAEARARDGEEEALASATEAREAAEKEKNARAVAQRRLDQLVKANEILNAIFYHLDPNTERNGGPTLRELLARRVLAAAAQLKGETIGDPLILAHLQDNLGMTLFSLGYPRQASALLIEARKIWEARLGADHPKTLATVGALALAYEDDGRGDLALPLFDQVMRRSQKKLGPDHPNTLTAMQNLATAYQADGKVRQALPLLEKALQLSARRPNDPQTVRIMSHLGTAYREAGQLRKALPLLEKALEKQKKVLPPDHPSTLATMHNLGAAYFDAGKKDDGLAMMRTAWKRSQNKLGDDHRDTLTSQGTLANLYLAAGQQDEGLRLLETGLEKARDKYGADNPLALKFMAALAEGYLNAEQPAKAVRLLVPALKRMKERPGPGHPETLRVMGNLAGAYLALNQMDDALPLLRDFLAGRRKQLGRDNLYFAGILAQTGHLLLMHGQHAEAEKALRECLAIRQKKQPDAFTTFNARSLLGGALLAQKKYAEAEPFLLEGYQGMRQREAQAPTGAQGRLSEALERLVQLYEAWGHKDKAEQWRQKLNAMKRR